MSFGCAPAQDGGRFFFSVRLVRNLSSKFCYFSHSTTWASLPMLLHCKFLLSWTFFLADSGSAFVFMTGKPLSCQGRHLGCSHLFVYIHDRAPVKLLDTNRCTVLNQVEIPLDPKVGAHPFQHWHQTWHFPMMTGHLFKLCMTMTCLLTSMVAPPDTNPSTLPVAKSVTPSLSLVPQSLLTCTATPTHAMSACLLVAQRATNRPLRHTTHKPCAPLTILALHTIMLLAGDVEPNPGPSQTAPCLICDKGVSWRSKALQCDGCNRWLHARCIAIDNRTFTTLQNNPDPWLCPQCAPCQINFPCTICRKAVTWEAKALQCDGCDCWTHIGCATMGENTYNDLQDSSKLWLCLGCGIPNNTDLINTYNVSVSNSFDVLNYNLSLEENTDLDSTVNSDTVLLNPQSASTPESREPRPNNKRVLRRSLKIVNLNCRSVTKNRDRLGVLIDSIKPDIIIGTESFLTKDIATPTELDAYNVERRDRDTRRGGVFIAAKDDLLLTRYMTLKLTVRCYGARSTFKALEPYILAHSTALTCLTAPVWTNLHPPLPESLQTT